jgi:hypothetical protein
MVWIPLSHRLPQLPLILAGPVLRRTEPAAVTLWLAVRQPCLVTLRVYATAAEGTQVGPLVLAGERLTVALGQHLHLVTVTARPLAEELLQTERIYAYDLSFDRQDQTPPLGLQSALSPEGSAGSISYFDHQLPTFLLPPPTVSTLKLLHGSCRKPHGGDIDALPIVDDLLAQSAASVDQRPHQLFLTGDQIYGDDVTEPWLLALTDAGDTLLGWEEILPTPSAQQPALAPLRAKYLPPGDRAAVAGQLAGFTAGVPNQPERLTSHLLSFGEYLTAYLFAWSPTLWGDFPPGAERYRERSRSIAWDRQVAVLNAFYGTLGKVRRALANIPTYMIFDDHDISDDWYLNRAWCERVLGNPLGRRVVQNGLLAYALVQAWGNTPDQFEPGTGGDGLLQTAQTWASSQGTDPQAEMSLGEWLGLPFQDSAGQPSFKVDQQVWVLDRPAHGLTWHYTVRSACHEVLVLDTRTWRGYPIQPETKAVPMLLSPTAFDQQLRQPLGQTQTQGLLTLVVAPTNVIHMGLVDWMQRWSLRQGRVFGYDVGDAWNLHQGAFFKLLAALFADRDRIIVLSGDIHYGFAVRLTYWTHPATATPTPHLLVQLTASAFKNAEVKTQILQTKVKHLWPESSQDWIGWNHPPQQKKLSAWPQVGGQIWPFPWPRRGPRPSPPDWHYRIEWVKRQPAHSPPWAKHRPWLRPSKFVGTPQGWGWRWLRWLWANRWLQEGPEAVGLSNLGLVQLGAPAAPGGTPTVCQDLYWCPPWQPDSLVISRFETEFAPQPSPRPGIRLNRDKSLGDGRS